MKLFASRKIIIPECEKRSVEIAVNSAKLIDFVSYSTWNHRRKQAKLTLEETNNLVNKVLGSMIEEKISVMILEEIIFKHGSKKMLKAYNKAQEQSQKAVKEYFKGLVCKKDEEIKSNKK